MAGVNQSYKPHWPPYPPCVNDDCDHTKWPELVGKKFDEAKAVIHSNAPYVTIIKLGPDMIGLTDFCCNRVYVRTDKQDIVVTPPEIGLKQGYVPPYPPCANGDCSDIEWPELVGKKFVEAKAVIQRDAPYVTIIKVDPLQTTAAIVFLSGPTSKTLS